MATALVPDCLWHVIEPLLPLPRPKPQGGRPRVPDRACLKGILFVLRSGVPWEMLPKELGCGSGMTCWRRLRDWQNAGTSLYWIGYPVTPRLTGPKLWWTAVQFERFLGAADGTESD